jgi:hypothetical protein
MAYEWGAVAKVAGEVSIGYQLTQRPTGAGLRRVPELRLAAC